MQNKSYCEYLHKQQELSLKTSSTSHLLSETMPMKEETKKWITRIEKALQTLIRGENDIVYLVNGCDKCMDEIGKEDNSLCNLIAELKTQYNNCIEIVRNESKSAIGIEIEHRKQIETQLKLANKEKEMLLQELKECNKCIEKQNEKIRQMSQIDKTKEELNKYKEYYLQAKSSNIAIQSENSQLQAQVSVLKDQLKALQKSRNKDEGNLNADLKDEPKQKPSAVPRLDFTKMQKATYSYIPLIKKSKHTHHSLSSSRENTPHAKQSITKLDISLVSSIIPPSESKMQNNYK